MFRSLGLRTDEMVMARRSAFEDRGDHIVQRTPDEPTFWFGNQVIWKTAADDPAPMLAAFDAAFPEAAHCVLSLDVPNITVPDWAAGLDGFEGDSADVLSLEGPILGPDVPEGFEFRPLSSETDWLSLIGCQTRTGIEEGFSAETHRAYVTDKVTAIRQECVAGRSTWFGIFDGDTLAADMGIVSDGVLARFQSVETMPEYRKQGLCAALLRQVHDVTAARYPGVQFVIVADSDGEAGRIYRRAGFAFTERLFSLMKRGY